MKMKGRAGRVTDKSRKGVREKEQEGERSAVVKRAEEIAERAID